MKKAVSLILAALALSASLVSCGSDSDLLTRKYNYDLSEYITLGDYKNLPAEGYRFEVSDAEIQQQVLATRSYYARTNDVTDRPAQAGDIVYIDYVGTIGGEEFEGGSETDCEVTIGIGTFMEGFEESLIGKNPGDSYAIDLTFPDPYPAYPENAGKDVHFEITVDSILEQELPFTTTTSPVLIWVMTPPQTSKSTYAPCWKITTTESSWNTLTVRSGPHIWKAFPLSSIPKRKWRKCTTTSSPPTPHTRKLWV